MKESSLNKLARFGSRVFIIQPVVPEYRISFFEKVNDFLQIEIYCSKIDQLGVRSIEDLKVYKYINNLSLNCFFKKTILWQENIKADFKPEDVLVINGNPRFLSNLILLLRAKKAGTTVIWWGHGWSSTSKPWRAKLRICMTRVLADKVLLYTEKERQSYIKIGFPENKVFALNNGIDTSSSNILRQSISSKNINCFIKSKGFDDKRLVLFVGRLTEKSRGELLIKALDQLAGDIHVIFVGDGVEKQHLIELCVSMNVEDRVTFTGAIFEEELLAYWMLASHAFVYPGAVGLSLLHAFSYGLPAVIHSDDEYQMPEHAAFKNEYNGFYFERENVQSLAASITKLLESPKHKEMRENALRTVQNSYNVDDMVKRFIQAVD